MGSAQKKTRPRGHHTHLHQRRHPRERRKDLAENRAEAGLVRKRDGDDRDLVAIGERDEERERKRHLEGDQRALKLEGVRLDVEANLLDEELEVVKAQHRTKEAQPLERPEFDSAKNEVAETNAQTLGVGRDESHTSAAALRRAELENEGLRERGKDVAQVDLGLLGEW